MTESTIYAREARRCLCDFHFGELSPADFSSWLCRTEGFEDLVGGDNYFELVDVNYSDRDDIQSAKKVVRKLYHEVFHRDIVQDWVRNTLNAMLDETMSLRVGCVRLWTLRLNGAAFIPSVFSGYASELEEGVDENFYRERILRDVKEFLNDFDSD